MTTSHIQGINTANNKINFSIPKNSQLLLQQKFSCNEGVVNDRKKQNHLLKFIDNPSSDRGSKPTGVRCLFHNSYAVSFQSPDCFKTKNTLVMKSNSPKYHNRSSQNPELQFAKNKNNDKEQKFYHNKNYFKINDQRDQQLFFQQYLKTLKLEQKPFNKSMADQTKYISVNILNRWGHNNPLMGFQRDIESRQLCNKDRQNKIKQKRTTRQNFIRTFYEERKINNKISSNHRKSSTNEKSRGIIIKKKISSELISSKVKVRQDRNLLANRLHEETNSYLLKDKNYEYKSIRGFNSAEHFQTQRNYENKLFYSRPLTGTSKKSRKYQKNQQRLQNLIKKHGNMDDMTEDYHKRANSTLQVTNITEQRGQQMINRVEEWANKTQMKKLYPCQSLVRQQQINKNLLLEKNRKEINMG